MKFKIIKRYGSGGKVIDTFTERHFRAEWEELMDYVMVDMEPDDTIEIIVEKIEP